MTTIYRHTGGRTECVPRVDPAWLLPESGVVLWVDINNPGPEDARLLSETFKFHELAVEDALSAIHHPKVESYDGYLYLILHRIGFEADAHRFQTFDVDFFLGHNYLVTVHVGGSRSLAEIAGACGRNPQVLAEGPAALMHRIIDTMVDHYLPEVEALQERLDDLERQVFEAPSPELARSILALKRDVSSLRRVTLPQRDVLARLARREFPYISDPLAYRYRDVHDHLVRVADESLTMHDRITSLLDAHLTNVSNQLNSVMKVLTIIATIFMPLTVLTGMYGMNVDLPVLPGGAEIQFWWVVVLMLTISGTMLWFFRRRGWL